MIIVHSILVGIMYMVLDQNMSHFIIEQPLHTLAIPVIEFQVRGYTIS